MDKRQNFATNGSKTNKNKDPIKYRETQKEIRFEIMRAKEGWLVERCKEIEELEAKHDSFNMYKKVKQAAGNYRNKSNNILMNERQ